MERKEKRRQDNGVLGKVWNELVDVWVWVWARKCVYRFQNFHPDPILLIWDQDAGQRQSEGLCCGEGQAAPRRGVLHRRGHHPAEPQAQHWSRPRLMAHGTHCIREQTALSLVVLVIDLGWFWVDLNDTLLTYARFGYKKHLLRRIWLQFPNGSSHFHTFWLHFCEGHDTMMSLLFSHGSIPVKYRMSTGQVLWRS